MTAKWWFTTYRVWTCAINWLSRHPNHSDIAQLPPSSTYDKPSELMGSLCTFNKAFICYQCKRIFSQSTDRNDYPMISWLMIWQARTTKKRDRKQLCGCCTILRGAQTLITTLCNRYMMYLVLVPEVWAQTLSWWHPEVNQCANDVATRALLWDFITCVLALSYTYINNCNAVKTQMG